jgi:hypothetical protein
VRGARLVFHQEKAHLLIPGNPAHDSRGHMNER